MDFGGLLLLIRSLGMSDGFSKGETITENIINYNLDFLPDSD